MIQKDYIHRIAVNKMIQDEIEKNFLHKDFVASNFILKSELNVVNILVSIDAAGKRKKQLFEELSEKYKDENKSLILMDNSNMDTQLQFELPNKKKGTTSRYILRKLTIYFTRQIRGLNGLLKLLI